jgi:Fe2+ transport system protein FeoA
LDLPDTSALRLKALGIFEGQRIELAKRGSPMIVKAAGGRVAIAEEIARRILVRAAHE